MVKVFLENLEEVDSLEALASLDRKVKEGTQASLVPLESLAPRSSWRKETMATQASVVYPASPDPEVTKVSPVSLGDRVCLVCLASPSKVKVFPGSLVSQGSLGVQVSLDQKERAVSMDSPE